MALSTRSQNMARCAEGLKIWQVVSNLWNPENNPGGILSLGVAENSLMHDTLSKHIHDNLALSTAAFTYGDGTTGTKRVKKAMAAFLNNHLKPVKALEPSHLSVTNGCSAAIEHLSWALANPGEGILLGQPYYGTFIPDLTARFGATVLPVPFHGVDPLGDDAVAKYEDVILAAKEKGKRASALLISHPHNPLGRCYPRQVLIGFMKLCEKYQLHFISDEIYALSTFSNTVDKAPPPVAFESALSIDPTGIIDPARVHVLWGMSKDFGANGIRVGVLVSQSNPTLHASITATGLYSSVSSISDHATVNILEDHEWAESYMAENRRRLSEQYTHVVNWARRHSVEYAPGVNAALFLWVNLGDSYKAHQPVPETEDITDLIENKLLAKKVFLASGKAFGSEKPGWFRIVFSHDSEVLDLGLGRVAEALFGEVE